MKGIYCFIDRKTDEVVYVGKDSNINVNRRCKAHYWKSKYNDQPINRVLQNNKGRYKYKVLKKGDFKNNLLNVLEILYIRRYNPKFNFTIGGDGVPKGTKSPMAGKHHSEETKEKIRQSKLGRKVSDETKRKLSIVKSGENNHNYGKTFSKDHVLKLSKSHNNTGFFRVSKTYNKKFKQGFQYIYSYYLNKSQKQIASVNLNKLEEKVKDKGLEWFVVDEDKANKTMKEANYV